MRSPLAPPAVGLALIACAASAWAASPAESGRAVVKVVALGAPELVGSTGLAPVATLPAISGSGVVVSPRCIVVTNYHVVAGATAVAVRFPGEERLVAAAVASLAAREDVAVLVVDRARCAAIVAVPAPAQPGAAGSAPVLPGPGTSIAKIGWGGATEDLALRTRGAAVVRGAVSRPGRAAGDLVLEVYVPVSPGDSGGLVCDDDGHMVGLARAHDRVRSEVGYVVPAATVAAVLRAAAPAIERERGFMVRPAWAHEAVAAETAAELAEAGRDPQAALRLARERDAALTLLAAPPPGLRPLARLVIAAMVWNLGAAHLDAPATRGAGCRLLAAAAALLPAAATDDALRRGFAPRLRAAAEATAQQAHCGGASAAPGRAGGARVTAAGPVVLGTRADLYARWVVTAYGGAGAVGVSPLGVQAGVTVPVLASGDVDLGLGLAYSFAHLEEEVGSALHRIEVPVRLGYRALFLEVGGAACFTDLSAATVEARWRSGGGLVVRAGARKSFVQGGAAYVNLPVGGGRLHGGEFFVGVVW